MRCELGLLLLALQFGLSWLAHAEGVGFREVTVAAEGESLAVAIWYPTKMVGGSSQQSPFTIEAIRQAQPSEGPHSLVLLLHGTGGSNLSHRHTAQHLARGGYIVAALEHAGDSWRDHSRSGAIASWHYRPLQMRAVLDWLLSDSDFAVQIDRDRIGAMGYSTGGYTVLALIGGRPEPGRLRVHCTTRHHLDETFCGYSRPEPGGQDRPALADLHDNRIRAAVAVAPVGAIFGPGAFDTVTLPVALHRLGDDEVVRAPWHAEHVAWLLGEQASLTVHSGVHHFAFISPFPPSLRESVGSPARAPRGFDRLVFLNLINEQILQFFNAELPPHECSGPGQGVRHRGGGLPPAGLGPNQFLRVEAAFSAGI